MSTISALDENTSTARSPAKVSQLEIAPANDNWPIVKLVPVGDGVALARALVCVLVRRALIREGVLSDPAGCDEQARAG